MPAKLFRSLLNFMGFSARDFRTFITGITGFKPGNIYLYEEAFRHRSSVENHHNKLSNERLEFLGDAVIELVVRDFLFRKFSDKTEGDLTALRVKIVNREFLGKLGKKMELYRFLQLEETNKKRLLKESNSLHGNALEALTGAVFLDKGFDVAKMFFIQRVLLKYIDLREVMDQTIDFKSRLMEWSQKYNRKVRFRLLKDSDGNDFFEVELLVDGKAISTGQGRRKKKAENNAAKAAFEQGKIEYEDF